MLYMYIGTILYYQWWYNHVEILQMSIFWSSKDRMEYIYKKLDTERENDSMISCTDYRDCHVVVVVYVVAVVVDDDVVLVVVVIVYVCPRHRVTLQ